MLLDDLAISPSAFEQRTGWRLKPEGFCKGSHCVPAPDALNDDGTLDPLTLSERLGMPLVTDEATGTRVLGPESIGRALNTATAPELELPSIDGNPFSLSELHGRKVLLVAWASW